MINFTVNPKYKEIIYSIEKEYGEIGEFIVEDGFVEFSVYREYFENPLKTIQVNKKTKLLLIGRYDSPVYSLAYKIVNFT
jgi:hypothetical protein